MSILSPKRETDDRTLVRKAQQGSRDAFGQLVSRHHESVRCYLGRYLSNPEDVDDVAQEVFIGAMKGVVRFERKSTFKTWLLSIARNKAITRLRVAQNDPASSMDRIEKLVLDSQLQELISTDGNHEQLSALQGCISELTEPYRKLIQRVYFDGQRISDIAEQTGKKRNSVRMRLMRIRRALSSCIKKKMVTS